MSSRRPVQSSVVIAAVILTAASAVSYEPPAELNGWPRVFFDDFESGNLDRWQPSDPKAWKADVFEGRKVAHQFDQSQVKTPVRSPFNRSVVKDLIVSDCVLDVQLRTTARDYPHRSLCLFFGYQDPAHMYYVHLGQKADDHANQIFIVNNEPRKKIFDEDDRRHSLGRQMASCAHRSRCQIRRHRRLLGRHENSRDAGGRQVIHLGPGRHRLVRRHRSVRRRRRVWNQGRSAEAIGF